MKIVRSIGFAFAAGFLLAAATTWVPASRGQAPAARPAVIWEYKSVVFGKGPADLDSLGKEGRELVTAGDYNSGTLYIFKRPKP